MDALRLLDDAPGRPGDPSIVDEPLRLAGLRSRAPLVRCPRCRYRPRRRDRWVCRPSCGTVWNTFATRGRCPGCGLQWAVTACPACHEISPHLAWYEPADDAGPSASS